MEKDMLASLYLAIQNKIEEEMDKVSDELLNKFAEQLKIQKEKAVSEVMKNVIIAFHREVDNSLNYTITFKNIVEKVEE